MSSGTSFSSTPSSPKSVKLASRRPRRDIQPINYREHSSEEEDSFISVDSNIPETRTPVSPSHPEFILQQTPPQTDQVLEEASGKLQWVQSVQDIQPNWPALGDQPAEDAAMASFETENGTDDANALQSSCRAMEKIEWDDNDVEFFFAQTEIKMASHGVKKQFTKFQALSTTLPKKVIDQVKPLMRKKETDFTSNDSYLLLKNEIMRIFGPKPEASVDRALTRVLVDTPSNLARTLVNDICKHELDGCCCPAIVLSLWKRQLPTSVKAGIAGMKLTKDTFNATVTHADEVFDSVNPSGATASVAAIKAQPSLDQTLPALQSSVVPEVNAIRGGRNRGRGRGGRGRGRGQAPSAPSGPSGPKHKGAKHPDLPSGDWTGCQMHHRWGRGAFFCSEPGTCPWRNVFAPKPTK